MASTFFNYIKAFYKEKKYTKAQLSVFVNNTGKVSITEAEYKKITGTAYVAPTKEEDNTIVMGSSDDVVKENPTTTTEK